MFGANAFTWCSLGVFWWFVLLWAGLHMLNVLIPLGVPINHLGFALMELGVVRDPVQCNPETPTGLTGTYARGVKVGCWLPLTFEVAFMAPGNWVSTVRVE